MLENLSGQEISFTLSRYKISGHLKILKIQLFLKPGNWPSNYFQKILESTDRPPRSFSYKFANKKCEQPLKDIQIAFIFEKFTKKI